MPTQINRDIQLLTYAEARAELNAVNPELCQEIDLLDVDHRYPLLKMRYLYGDLLLNKGKFFVPDGKGGLIFKDSPECDRRVRELLDYAPSMPTLAVLTRGLEIFLDLEQRAIPSLMGQAGYIFGLTAVLEPSTRRDPSIYWSICAGARSVQMVPKISEQYEHKRLCRELNFSTLPPKTPDEQFAVFKAIARAQPDTIWTAEVLVFTGAWFTDRISIPWRVFREYLFQKTWHIQSYRMNHELYWLLLSQITARFKPSPDLIMTLEYIVYLTQNHRLGHYFATDDSVMPASWIQQAYIEGYRLRNNQRPDILCPAYLDDIGQVFYSLSYPNRSDFARANNTSLSKRENLDNLLRLLNELQLRLAADTEAAFAVLNKIRHTNYQGIHPHGDTEGAVISTEVLAQRYPSTTQGQFSTQSLFFYGAVLISTDPKKPATQ